MHTWTLWIVFSLTPLAAALVLGARALRGGTDERADFRDLSEPIEWLAPGLVVLAAHVLCVSRQAFPTSAAAISAGALVVTIITLSVLELALESQAPFPARPALKYRAMKVVMAAMPAAALGTYLTVSAALDSTRGGFAPSIRLFVTCYFAMYIGGLLGGLLARKFGRWERLAPCELYANVLATASAGGAEVSDVRVLQTDAQTWAGAIAHHETCIGLGEALVRHFTRREVDAVVAHEVGHLADRSIWTMNSVYNYMGFFVFLGLMALLHGKLMLFARPLGPLHIAWWLALFLVPQVLSRLYSRNRERKAEGSMERLADPHAIVSCHYKLALLNDYPLDRPAWSRALHTHPTLMETVRITAKAHNISSTEIEDIFRQAEADLHNAAADRYEPVYYDELQPDRIDRGSRRTSVIALSVLAGVVLMVVCLVFGLTLLSRYSGTAFGYVTAGSVISGIAVMIAPIVIYDRKTLRNLRRRTRDKLAGLYGAECNESAVLVDALFFEDWDEHVWQGALLDIADGQFRLLGEGRHVSVPLDAVVRVIKATDGGNTSFSLEATAAAVDYKVEGVFNRLLVKPLGKPEKGQPRSVRRLVAWLKDELTRAGAQLEKPPRLTLGYVGRCALRLPLAIGALAAICYGLHLFLKHTGLNASVGDIPVYFVGFALLQVALNWALARDTPEAEGAGDQMR